MAKATSQVQTREPLSGIQMFGPADHNTRGERSSEYPGWYFKEQIDELQESVTSLERNLKLGLIPESEREVQQARLRQDKERLSSIMESIPKMSEVEKVRLQKFRSDMGKRISEAMFTYSDMQRGTADAHEEARRMSEPCVSVKDENGDMATIVKACGVDHISPKGLITRTDAERAWKIISGYLGENTNTETLRSRQ